MQCRMCENVKKTWKMNNARNWKNAPNCHATNWKTRQTVARQSGIASKWDAPNWIASNRHASKRTRQSGLTAKRGATERSEPASEGVRGSVPCHYGACHYGACQYDASAMAHARLAQVQYDAGPVWRISLWHRTSMTHFTMAHSTIAQVHYGAFLYAAVLAGVALLGPVHTCSGSRSGTIPVPFHSFV